ncbi:NAD-dependent epimerase/dehydratase family protein [Georgenia wangjunii]|uniref:NAD-dependent epimerase/dehydratase family protein n=1 Tax=Georgenia wangjunii TaxID=3117730 RepID=UPI003D9C47EC
MTTIGLLGSSGFVGSAIVAHARKLGIRVRTAPAPRLKSYARDLERLHSELAGFRATTMETMASLRGVDVLINAAGYAQPSRAWSAEMLGANAALPAVLSFYAEDIGYRRIVHVSSAAVFGTSLILDESRKPSPITPYGQSKDLGDRALTTFAPNALLPVVYWPTSVHGKSRRLTQSLARFARSPLSSVAGDGGTPTPQALVANVAAAAVFLACAESPPPRGVLHPWEGLTTGTLLAGLGQGRRPRTIPGPVARSALKSVYAAGRVSPRTFANARRLEMLWFGQEQERGWLEEAGFAKPTQWQQFFRDLGSGAADTDA